MQRHREISRRKLLLDRRVPGQFSSYLFLYLNNEHNGNDDDDDDDDDDHRSLIAGETVYPRL